MAGSAVFPPTFAEVTLSDQSPEHVGAVVAVGRPVEGLLREEMTVTGVEVDGVVPAGHLVAAVVRDPDEIRCARSHGRADRRTENPS